MIFNVTIIQKYAPPIVPPVDLSVFGDGSDGDFFLNAGETHIEHVAVPHNSIVIKQYKSFKMGIGSVYKCDDYNAGLVIQVQGNCTVNGTIDQSGKAPNTNENNSYHYPDFLCGAGGNGHHAVGGKGLPGRVYGGGFGGGGASKDMVAGGDATWNAAGIGGIGKSGHRGGDGARDAGGVVILYVGGNYACEGAINCNATEDGHDGSLV